MPTAPSTAPQSDTLDFSTQRGAFHAVRTICDQLGLPIARTINVGGVLYAPKDILCACLYQESRFFNRLPDGSPTKNQNKDKLGKVWSTDWGLCQVNDYFHIGPDKDFATVEYVIDHPEKVVKWMALILKNTGELEPWSSYSSGIYRRWLSTASPMWLLRS